MFQLNGKKISIDRDLTIGEGVEAITYPTGSLKSAELRAELGIVELPDQVRPDERLYYVTENDDGSFNTVPRPRDQITRPVWDLIQVRREMVKYGGVQVDGKWFHTDDASRIQYLGLKDQARDILVAGQPDITRLQKLGQDVPWKTMDGSFIYLTVKLVFDIVSAVGDLDAMAFAAAEQHRDAMEAVDNPFEYDYSGGWPQTFTDTQA